MPRSLYTLEGQQLRRLADLAERGVAWPALSATHPNREIMEIVKDILADGPTIRDEED